MVGEQLENAEDLIRNRRTHLNHDRFFTNSLGVLRLFGNGINDCLGIRKSQNVKGTNNNVPFVDRQGKFKIFVDNIISFVYGLLIMFTVMFMKNIKFMFSTLLSKETSFVFRVPV